MIPIRHSSVSTLVAAQKAHGVLGLQSRCGETDLPGTLLVRVWQSLNIIYETSNGIERHCFDLGAQSVLGLHAPPFTYPPRSLPLTTSLVFLYLTSSSSYGSSSSRRSEGVSDALEASDASPVSSPPLACRRRKYPGAAWTEEGL